MVIDTIFLVMMEYQEFDEFDMKLVYLAIRVGGRVPIESQPYIPFDRFKDSILAAFPTADLAYAFRKRSQSPDRVIIQTIAWYDQPSDK